MTSRKIKHVAGELCGLLVGVAIFFLWATGVQLLFSERPGVITSAIITVSMLCLSAKLLSSPWGRVKIKHRKTLAIALFALCFTILPFMRAGLAYFSHQKIDWLGVTLSSLAVVTIPILGSGYFFHRAARDINGQA